MSTTPQPPAPAPLPKKRCLIYVDGFNLYYGVLEPCPAWKWLNLQSLFEALRPDEEIVAVTLAADPAAHPPPRSAAQSRTSSLWSCAPVLPVAQLNGRPAFLTLPPTAAPAGYNQRGVGLC